MGGGHLCKFFYRSFEMSIVCRLKMTIGFGSITLLSKQFWSYDVPSRVLVFSWRLLLNRLPIWENLLKRDVDLTATDHLCAFCNGFEENHQSHLFLSCQFTSQIRYAMLSLDG